MNVGEGQGPRVPALPQAPSQPFKGAGEAGPKVLPSPALEKAKGIGGGVLGVGAKGPLAPSPLPQNSTNHND